MWPNTKTQIVTKLKNSNYDKTKKKMWQLKLWQNTKIKLWQNSKTVATVAVVHCPAAVMTAVIVTSFSNNSLTPRQPMRCSWCSFLRFSRCFIIDSKGAGILLSFKALLQYFSFLLLLKLETIYIFFRIKKKKKKSVRNNKLSFQNLSYKAKLREISSKNIFFVFWCFCVFSAGKKEIIYTD